MEDKILEDYQLKFLELQVFLKNKYNKEFTPDFLSALLVHHFDEEDVHTYLINKGLSEKVNLISIVEDKLPYILGSFAFDSLEFDLLISSKLEKARIQNNGKIWLIYKYDIDPFPSNPHAHEKDLNIKLNLKTGEYYKRGKYNGTLSKNEFKRLVQKIEAKGIKLP